MMTDAAIRIVEGGTILDRIDAMRVFIAGLDGVLRAFNTADGSLIRSIQLPAGANAPFAIANDLLLVPAGSFFVPSADSIGEPAMPFPQVVAFKLGATGEVTMGPAIESAGPGTPTAGQTTEVTISLRDIYFDPSTFSMPADTDVTLTISNLGAAVHNFNIDGNANPSDPNIHSGDVLPGDTTTLTINLPTGKWFYYCNIPGHVAAGMVGIITVV